MEYKEFKHIIPVQVRFTDIDRVNHVNNACYHTYIELGRVHYFNEVLKRGVNWDEKGFVLARTEIDHAQPIFLVDEVFCCTKVTRLGTKSITIKSAILKKENSAFVECAVASGILVAMDYKLNLSIPVPETWRELFSSYEGY